MAAVAAPRRSASAFAARRLMAEKNTAEVVISSNRMFLVCFSFRPRVNSLRWVLRASVWHVALEWIRIDSGQ